MAHLKHGDFYEPGNALIRGDLEVLGNFLINGSSVANAPGVVGDGSNGLTVTGVVQAADFEDTVGNFVIKTVRGSVARTDTAEKKLGTLPAGAQVVGVRVFSPAASNAVTTATLSVGYTGTDTDILSGYDVKTATTGAGQTTPRTGVSMVNPVAQTDVYGIYAETGGASSTGGPWTVCIDYI